MKRIVLLTALLVTVFSATAYTGYTGPQDQPHIMGSTGGSSSASQSVSENGTDWRMTFSEVSAGSTNQSTGVLNHSFGNNTLRFNGSVQIPNPCYALEAEVEKDDEHSYIFNINSTQVGDDRACSEVISYRSYNATFETDSYFMLEVQHNGKVAKTLSHPDYPGRNGEPHPDSSEKRSTVQKLVSWVQGLFGMSQEKPAYPDEE